jgi:hypothetical protein
MTEITNIPGEFKIMLAGKEKTLKATFGAVEKLENELFRRTVFEVLSDAMTGKFAYRDVISVIQVGLEAARNDTRMTRQEIGEAVFADGLNEFAPVVAEYLAYCLTGGKKQGANKASGEA